MANDFRWSPETRLSVFEREDMGEDFKIAANARAGHDFVVSYGVPPKTILLYCRGCGCLIDEGAPIIRKEDRNCYLNDRRARVWHRDCWPENIDKEWERLRQKFIAAGGWVA